MKPAPKVALVAAAAAAIAASVLVLRDRSVTPSRATDISDTPVAGGRLAAAYRSEPRSLNRLVSAFVAEDLLAHLTHATLVRVNRATGALEPRLARAWTIAPDGLTWTLELEKDVRFADDMPFTAADVLFSFEAAYDTKGGSVLAAELSVGDTPLAVRATGDHTVVITLPSPYGPGLEMLDALPILPRHKLRAALDAGTLKDAWAVTAQPTEIVGLGPFVLKEYVPGQRMTLDRNPHYWKKDAKGARLPYLDGIDLHLVPEQNAEVLRLQTGQLDLMVDQIRFEDYAALEADQARGSSRLMDAGVSLNTDGLWFNLAPGVAAAKDRPWLQKDELRQAVSFAVDRDAIVKTVFLGQAVPVYGPVTPGHRQWFVADLPQTPYDPARAKALLASIGLEDRTGDGVAEDAAGRPARFSILTQRGHTIRERTIAVVQEQLQKVGLAVDVVALDANGIFGRFMAKDYDAIYFWASWSSPDPARNPEFWTSAGPYHFWHPSQKTPATKWEGEIDELMRRQATSTDPAERVRLAADAQRLLAAHLPIVNFAAPRVTVAMSARVRGATPAVVPPMVLWNAEGLWVAR